VYALVIISDHDWGRRTRSHDSPLVVDHLEVDMKSDFFAMMPTITRDAHREDHRSSGEIEFLWAVELE